MPRARVIFCDAAAYDEGYISPDDIDTGAPLFVEGLGLDSIDALELGLALQKRYGVALSADSQETRRHFASVRALADFVASQGKA